MKVKFFAKYSTQRLKYVLSFLEERITHFNWEVIIDRQPKNSEEGIVILYGIPNISLPNAIHIPDEGLLIDNSTLKPYNHPDQEMVKKVFHSDFSFSLQLPFDILAFIFFQLSRMEEYQPVTTDVHGRFAAPQSQAYRYQYLDIPTVDLMISKFKNLLGDFFGLKPIPSLITFDIDMAFAFQQKPFYLQWLGVFKDLIRRDFKRIQFRIATILLNKKDPYDTFDYLTNLCLERNFKTIFFFLVGKNGPFDRNNAPQKSKMQETILNISRHFQVGLHPSYRSNKEPEWVAKEKNILEKIINKKVTQSRQHYLKLSFPDTYQNLISSGICEDYSMGYPDTHGYRAGTAGSFIWYDLEKEKATDLRIYPFQIMDVTLKKYLNLKPEKAIEKLSTHYNQKPFTLIWHNSNLSQLEGWDHWKKVLEKLITWQL